VTLFGWDASDFDWGRGSMDLVAAKNDGITFFTHKATEGTSIRHVHFAEAVRRARAAGVAVVGAYGVPRTPSSQAGSVSAQVDYFLTYLATAPPVDFIQCDLERWSNALGVVYDAVSPAVGAEWCALAVQRSGKTVVLYAPRWAYGNAIPQPWTLWESDYGVNPAGHYRESYPGDDSPRWAAYSGRTPAILQYGSRLTIGTQPLCDANAYRGTLNQLKNLLGLPAVDAAEDEVSYPVLIVRDTSRSNMCYVSANLTELREIPDLATLDGIKSQLGPSHLNLARPDAQGSVQVNDVDNLAAFGLLRGPDTAGQFNPDGTLRPKVTP
jgi:hypothetical protein